MNRLDGGGGAFTLKPKTISSVLLNQEFPGITSMLCRKKTDKAVKVHNINIDSLALLHTLSLCKEKGSHLPSMLFLCLLVKHTVNAGDVNVIASHAAFSAAGLKNYIWCLHVCCLICSLQCAICYCCFFNTDSTGLPRAISSSSSSSSTKENKNMI